MPRTIMPSKDVELHISTPFTDVSKCPFAPDNMPARNLTTHLAAGHRTLSILHLTFCFSATS